jgi:hypothetical protein
MYNRYVDGLGTSPAADPAHYTVAARQLVQYGYRPSGESTESAASVRDDDGE